jgi:hypothetical protein
LQTTACIGEKPEKTQNCPSLLRSMQPRTLSVCESDRYSAIARRMQKDAAYAIGVPPYWFMGGPVKKRPSACEEKQSWMASRGRVS